MRAVNPTSMYLDHRYREQARSHKGLGHIVGELLEQLTAHEINEHPQFRRQVLA
jgi:hypothetical protein